MATTSSRLSSVVDDVMFSCIAMPQFVILKFRITWMATIHMWINGSSIFQEMVLKSFTFKFEQGFQNT